jgi:rubrerythrin
MKTSAQWWEETRVSTEKLADWLKKQYTGEVTAASRIREFASKFCNDIKSSKILKLIAEQEEQHAEWIKELLLTRGIRVEIGSAHEKYWKETLPAIESFETGTAIAAHAEKMRLERIKVISEDEMAASDIRETFKRILKDELFHEAAFRNMSTEKALTSTLHNHKDGMNALGLVV